MKKFLRKTAFVLSRIITLPLEFLLMIYSIPVFLLDYVINLIKLEVPLSHSKLCKLYNLMKFSTKAIIANKKLTLNSVIEAYTDDDRISYIDKKVYDGSRV